MFPHHENEIAQSCAVTGREFARVWIHNGFVELSREKMSKSLGNVLTIRELFEQSPYGEAMTAEITRYALLSTHYRGPLEFSGQAFVEAKRALDGFYGLFQRLHETSGASRADASLSDALAEGEAVFRRSMDDDFHTPEGLATYQGLKSELNKLL